jgi:DNA-binding transcriptional regulator GbsR (MarR family)
MPLPPITEKFVLHWGEMGTKWGINRTVAQIHALLYLSDHPLQAEEIAQTLAVARSNVSTSLRELQSWGIIRTVHVLGDRRDHFESLKDPWTLFEMIMDERKRREIDPTIDLLRQILDRAEKEKIDPYVQERLTEMFDFLTIITAWYGRLRSLPRMALQKFLTIGTRSRKAKRSAAK